MRCHPDFAGASEEIEFVAASHAYEFLTYPLARALYDRYGVKIPTHPMSWPDDPAIPPLFGSSAVLKKLFHS